MLLLVTRSFFVPHPFSDCKAEMLLFASLFTEEERKEVCSCLAQLFEVRLRVSGLQGYPNFPEIASWKELRSHTSHHLLVTSCVQTHQCNHGDKPLLYFSVSWNGTEYNIHVTRSRFLCKNQESKDAEEVVTTVVGGEISWISYGSRLVWNVLTGMTKQENLTLEAELVLQ